MDGATLTALLDRINALADFGERLTTFDFAAWLAELEPIASARRNRLTTLATVRISATLTPAWKK